MMMNTVSIITVATLVISLSSFQSGMTENGIPIEMNHSTIVLNDTKNITASVFDLEDFLTKSNDDVPSYAERFEINQNTTKEELEKIKRKAENDGIDLDYTSKFDGNQLSKLSLKMSLDNKEEGRKQSLNTDLEVDGDFSYTLAWENDSRGQAIHIYYGKTEGFDENNTADNFGRSFGNRDSLTQKMNDDFDIEREKMKEEMDRMRKEMKSGSMRFDDEKSDSTAEGFRESSAREAKAMQAEMKEEMRKMKKEFKEERKAMEAEMKAQMKEMKQQQNQDKKDSNESKDKKDKKENGVGV